MGSEQFRGPRGASEGCAEVGGASSLHPEAPPRMLFAAAVDAVDGGDAERFPAVGGGHDAGDSAGE